MKLKRTLAAIIAATTMAVGIGSLSVSAVSVSDSWTVRCVNVYGAPTSASISDSCEILYSTNGAMAYCNSASHTMNGANGIVKINCTNYTMPERELNDIDEELCKPRVSGIVTSVKFSFTAVTDYGDVFNASGTIVARE